MSTNDFRYGDVILAAIDNKKARRLRGHKGDPDKLRPAVWVRDSFMAGWSGVAGMTTLSHYGNGEPRIPVEWTLSGRETYLWGGRIVWITNDSIHERLGHLSPADLEKVWQMHGDELASLGL